MYLEQSVTQAVVHRLDLGVVIEGVGAKLTAQARLLETTEGSLVGNHVVVVDPYGTANRVSFDAANNHGDQTYPALRALDTRMAVLMFLV